MKRTLGLLAIAIVALLAWRIVSSESGSAPSARPSAPPAPERPERSDDTEPLPEPATIAAERTTELDGIDLGASSDAADAKPGCREGLVVDGADRPVAEFRVVARATSATGADSQESDLPLRTIEGTEGRFDFGELEDGEWSLVALDRGGRRSAPVVIAVPWMGEPPRLVLVDRVDAQGIVLGRNDAPVEGARVFFAHAGEELPVPGDRDEPTPRAISETNGRFRIEGVEPGRAVLVASHPEHCESEYVRVTLRPGVPEEIVLRLRTGARVVGTIHPSMGELAGREVHLYSFNGSIGWRETTSDEQGRFAFERVIPQDYIVDLKTEHGAIRIGPDGKRAEDPPTKPQNRGVRKQIAARDGETTDVVLGAPQREIVLEGRAMRRGAPVAGLLVSTTPLEGAEDRGDDVTTAADGSFRLVLQGAGEHSFSFHSGRSSYYVDAKVPDVDRHEATFEIPGGRITGRLVDEHRRPIRGPVKVTVREEGSPPDDRPIYFDGKFEHGASDENGRFTFDLLPAGTYTIRAPDGAQWTRPPSYDPYGRATLRDVRVGNEPIPEVEVVVPSESRITGTVVDSLGEPLGGARLLLQDDQGRPCSTYWEAEAAVNGEFELRNVGPGRYHVRAWSDRRWAKSPLVVVESAGVATTRIEFR